MREYKTNNKNKIVKRNNVQVSLNNFVPSPPYHVMLRFLLEPGSAASTITGLTNANIGKAIGVQIFSASAYGLPSNGVLAPTTQGLFRYVKIRQVDLWGPTGGTCRLSLNANTQNLSYPKPSKSSESYGVTVKPHETLIVKAPFNMVLDTNLAGSAENFNVSFVQSSIAGADNTVILQMDCVCFS